MGDYILMDGDMAMFDAVFGAAMLVVPNPGILQGSGAGTIQGKAICVQGDESKVEVMCMYTKPPMFPVMGMGMLRIVGLAGDQIATMTKSGDKPVLLKGSTFQAQFMVTTPATNPPNIVMPVDTIPVYSGTGQFRTTNDLFQGT